MHDYTFQFFFGIVFLFILNYRRLSNLLSSVYLYIAAKRLLIRVFVRFWRFSNEVFFAISILVTTDKKARFNEKYISYSCNHIGIFLYADICNLKNEKLPSFATFFDDSSDTDRQTG